MIQIDTISQEGYEKVIRVTEPESGLESIIATQKIMNQNHISLCAIKFEEYSSQNQQLEQTLKYTSTMSKKVFYAGLPYTGGAITINSSAIKKFCNREIVLSKALEAANKIVNDMKINGDTALLQAISKYDNVDVNLKKIKVSDQEIQSAISSVDKSFVKAVNYAKKNIVKFYLVKVKADVMTAVQHNLLKQLLLQQMVRFLYVAHYQAIKKVISVI